MVVFLNDSRQQASHCKRVAAVAAAAAAVVAVAVFAVGKWKTTCRVLLSSLLPSPMLPFLPSPFLPFCLFGYFLSLFDPVSVADLFGRLSDCSRGSAPFSGAAHVWSVVNTDPPCVLPPCHVCVRNVAPIMQ